MAWLLQVGGDLLCSPLLHASPSVPHQCGRALGGLICALRRWRFRTAALDGGQLLSTGVGGG